MLVLGVAYKPDIADMRESPALKIIELLANAGADVSYHDPYVPSSAGARARVGRARPGRLRLRRRRHRPLGRSTTTTSSTTRSSSSTSATQPAKRGAGRTRSGSFEHDGSLWRASGYWGPNVARNFADLADLAWLCDVNGAAASGCACRYPSARLDASSSTSCSRTTALEAVAIATPVPTHYPLAKRALEAGKHVFVEKPPAMRGAEIEELVALAEERDLVLMPGHLLLYHPGVA